MWQVDLDSLEEQPRFTTWLEHRTTLSESEISDVSALCEHVFPEMFRRKINVFQYLDTMSRMQRTSVLRTLPALYRAIDRITNDDQERKALREAVLTESQTAPTTQDFWKIQQKRGLRQTRNGVPLIERVDIFEESFSDDEENYRVTFYCNPKQLQMLKKKTRPLVISELFE